MSHLPIQTNNIDSLAKYGLKRISCAIGVFDGLHLGHQELIKTLIEMAKRQNSTPTVISFSPHPRTILSTSSHPAILYPRHKKLELLGEMGVEAVVIINFTKGFANLPPNEFIRSFLKSDKVHLAGLCVGDDWRFGRKACGTVDTLHEFADKYSFLFTPVKKRFMDGRPISSTSIRDALAHGDFATANRMLGRKYTFKSKLIKSTDNKKNQHDVILELLGNVLPPTGKYRGFAILNGSKKSVNIRLEPPVQSEKGIIRHAVISNSIFPENIETEFEIGFTENCINN